METNDRINFIIQRGQSYGAITDSPYEKLSKFNLEPSFLETIKKKIELKQNFQIEINDLESIVVKIHEKITKLISHPDFDPIKEGLRSKYKKQYESYPFDFNGQTYYLYPISPRFPIDEEISEVLGFRDLINAHIERNEPLKYYFKIYA